MAGPASVDSLGGLTASALAADPALRAQTQRIFGNALKRAQYILDFGSDSERASLIKAIVPQMMRSLQDEQADHRAKAQRDAYDRMRAFCRGDSVPGAPPLPEPTPPKGGGAPLGNHDQPPTPSAAPAPSTPTPKKRAPRKKAT